MLHEMTTCRGKDRCNKGESTLPPLNENPEPQASGPSPTRPQPWALFFLLRDFPSHANAGVGICARLVYM